MSQATADAKTNKADDTALTTGDPGVPLKQDGYAPAIEHKTQLPGAQALTLVYDWLMDGAQRISEALGSQENEAVKQMLTEWMSVADTESQTLASKFAELYPDEPPLADMVTKKADTDTDGDADADDKTADDMPAPDPEPDPEKYKGLTATERLHKRLDWRKSQREAVEKKRLDELLTVKRMTKAAAGVVGEAADHLDDMAKSEGLKAGQRNLCRFHAGELKKLTTSEAGDEPDADAVEVERKRIDAEIQTKAATLAERLAREEIAKFKAIVDPVLKEITAESKKAKRELEKAKTGR